MKDMLHARKGAWSAWFWLFLLSVVASAVVYTWIFDNTGQSTLVAITFHFVSNVTFNLAIVSDRTNLFMTLSLVVTARPGDVVAPEAGQSNSGVTLCLRIGGHRCCQGAQIYWWR